MSSQTQNWQSSAAPPPLASIDEGNWFAVHTRARHEKAVQERLQEQGIATFLPLVTEVRRWSDRRKSVQLPLFNCYLFARVNPNNEHRQRVCRTLGVFGIVGARGAGLPVPEEQIEAVRILLAHRLPWSNHPFLKAGQRVRIRGGSLDGLEGVFLSRNGDRTLIISVDAIQRSLAVRIEGYDVQPL